MPKLSEVARVSEDKNLTRERAQQFDQKSTISISVMQDYIDQNPGLTNAQLAAHFYPDKTWKTAQTYMGSKLKRWADKGKLVRRRYNGVWHYYPHNFIVPGDPKLPGDVSKSYLCPEPGCGQKFKTVNARAAHARIHGKDRPSAMEAVTDYLRANPGKRYSEIVHSMDYPKGTISSTLNRIKMQGVLDYKDGKYYLRELAAMPLNTAPITGLAERAMQYVWEMDAQYDLAALKRFVKWYEEKI